MINEEKACGESLAMPQASLPGSPQAEPKASAQCRGKDGLASGVLIRTNAEQDWCLEGRSYIRLKFVFGSVMRGE